MVITGIAGPGGKVSYRAESQTETRPSSGTIVAEWTDGFGAIAFAKPKKADMEYIAYPPTRGSVRMAEPKIAAFSEDETADKAIRNAIRKELGFKTRKNPIFRYKEDGEYKSVPISFIQIEEEFNNFRVLGVFTSDGQYFRVHGSFLLFLQNLDTEKPSDIPA